MDPRIWIYTKMSWIRNTAMRHLFQSYVRMFCLDSIISVHDIDLAVTNFPLISQVGGGYPRTCFALITATKKMFRYKKSELVNSKKQENLWPF
jgi:hypothetical protein